MLRLICLGRSTLFTAKTLGRKAHLSSIPEVTPHKPELLYNAARKHVEPNEITLHTPWDLATSKRSLSNDSTVAAVVSSTKTIPDVGLIGTLAKSIPEIKPDYDLKACYVIGRNFCHKPIGENLDKELGSFAGDIVASIGFLHRNSVKKGNKDVLGVSFDRHVYERFSDSEFVWKDRLQTLIEEGVLEHNGVNSPFSSISKTHQEKIADKQKVKNIHTAIRNIEKMLVIRNSVLFSMKTWKPVTPHHS